MLALELLIYFYILIYFGLVGAFKVEDYRADKKKGNTRGASTKGQIHETEVDVEKNLDVRPRKAGVPVRGKKIVPWKQ